MKCTNNRILFIDLETQNNPYYGNIASPHCPDNYIVESGWRIDEVVSDDFKVIGSINSIRFNSKEEFINADPSTYFPIEGCDLLVAHNAAYEISWFLTYARESFEDFLRRGGRVYCTMHAEYLISDMIYQYPPLDEVAVKYGGTHKVDGIKLLWEQGVLTSDIDESLLHKYLTDPIEGDVANTAKVYYGQQDEIVKQSKQDMIPMRMKALVAFSYCEWFGMYIHMPTAKFNQEAQEQEIEDITNHLNESQLPEDLPTEFEFSWNSRHHKSALLFGGSCKYKKKIPYSPPKFEKEDHYQLYVPENTYIPVNEVHNYSLDNIIRYQSGKNKGDLKIFKIDSSTEKLKWGEGTYSFKGKINLNSLLPEVQDEYKTGGMYITSQLLCDGTPVYSTSSDSLELISKHGCDIANDLLRLASLEKDTGSFYLRETYGTSGEIKSKKGMLQFVIPHHEDGSGIIHHKLNTCVTSTGRLSSSQPKYWASY